MLAGSFNRRRSEGDSGNTLSTEFDVNALPQERLARSRLASEFRLSPGR